MLLAFNVLSPEDWLKTVGLVGLFAIVFAESGLLIGFFLPGDSLLFIAGAIAGGAMTDKFPDLQFNIWLVLLGVFIAAVAGDQVGYAIGRKAGPTMFNRPDSRLFKHEYVEKAEEFFDRHGPRAVILARFVPIVRTFCPVVAGVSKMDYSTFVRFNLVGGFVWGVGVTLLGYFLGQVEFMQDHLELMIFAIIGISLLPILFEVIRHRRDSRKSESSTTSSEV